jgi:hypothetical protein
MESFSGADFYFSCRTLLGECKFTTTLRILSEMPQAQALAKPDFISERIQLNEARLRCCNE